MKSLFLKSPNKSKSDLIRSLEKIKKKYQSKISENNISIKKENDIFKLNAVKKILFKKF